VQEFTFLAPHHWDGTTVEDRRPAARAYWDNAEPSHRDGHGAESFIDLMERVCQTRALIEQQKASPIVIFSHGEFIRAFWWRILLPQFEPNPDAMRRFRAFIHAFRYPNCGILKFHFDGDEIWNSAMSTSHLPPELLLL
jgi:probable phosphoglycerate mutase